MRSLFGLLLVAVLVLRTKADGEVQAQAFTPNEFRALYELMVQYKYGRADNCPTAIKYTADPIEDGEDLLIRHRDMQIGDNGLENCTDVGEQRVSLAENLVGSKLAEFLSDIGGNLDKRTVFEGLREELSGRKFYISVADASRTCGGRKWFERSETFFYFDESDTIRLTIVAKVTGGEPKFLSLPLVGNIRYMIAVTSGTTCIYRVQSDVANVILGSARPSDSPSSTPIPSESSSSSVSASQVPIASPTPSSSASASQIPARSPTPSSSSTPSASTSPSMLVSESTFPSRTPMSSPPPTQSSIPSASSSTSPLAPSSTPSATSSSTPSTVPSTTSSASLQPPSPTSSSSSIPSAIESPPPSISTSPSTSVSESTSPSNTAESSPSSTPSSIPSTTSSVSPQEPPPSPSTTPTETSPGLLSTLSATPTPSKSSTPSRSPTPLLTPTTTMTLSSSSVAQSIQATKTPTPSSQPPIAVATTRVTPFPTLSSPTPSGGLQNVGLGSATPTTTPSSAIAPLGSATPSTSTTPTPLPISGGSQFGSGDRNSSTLDGTSTCFPGSAMVTTSDGRSLRMDELRVGDAVWTGREYSRVLMFTHARRGVAARFVKVRTAVSSVRLTGGHYLYVDGVLKAAREVREGDVISSGVVIGVENVVEWGLYNPQTESGDIVVDGVRTSCYTDAVVPIVGHALLAPMRLAAWVVPGLVEVVGEGVDMVVHK